MAKGDHRRSEIAIGEQGGMQRHRLDNLGSGLTRQNQNLENRFTVASDRGERDYSDIMNRYGSFLDSGGYTPNFGAYPGYQDFADTGGYTPQNIQDIRARGLAPMRAAYANAQSNLNRNRALQGGYSPNYAAALAKMARELGYGLSDQATNVEAILADAIRQGKLAGLGGMTNIDSARATAELAGRGQQLQGISGMQNLYGTAPGMAQMFGNQMLDSSRNSLNLEQLNNQLAQMIISGTLGLSQVPGDYQSALGNIGSTLGLGGQIAGLFSPLGGSGGRGIRGLPGGQRGPF